MVLGPNFYEVFCANLPSDWTVLYEVRQRNVMHELDHTISWDEIKAAVINPTNGNFSALKKIPLNAFKEIKYDNLTHLLEFFNKY